LFESKLSQIYAGIFCTGLKEILEILKRIELGLSFLFIRSGMLAKNCSNLELRIFFSECNAEI
jgi:hypothetical protein